MKQINWVETKDFSVKLKTQFIGSIGIVLGMMLAALWRDSIDVDFLTQKHENKISIDVAGVHPSGSQIQNVKLKSIRIANFARC